MRLRSTCSSLLFGVIQTGWSGDLLPVESEKACYYHLSYYFDNPPFNESWQQWAGEKKKKKKDQWTNTICKVELIRSLFYHARVAAQWQQRSCAQPAAGDCLLFSASLSFPYLLWEVCVCWTPLRLTFRATHYLCGQPVPFLPSVTPFSNRSIEVKLGA